MHDRRERTIKTEAILAAFIRPVAEVFHPSQKTRRREDGARVGRRDESSADGRVKITKGYGEALS